MNIQDFQTSLGRKIFETTTRTQDDNLPSLLSLSSSPSPFSCVGWVDGVETMVGGRGRARVRSCSLCACACLPLLLSVCLIF